MTFFGFVFVIAIIFFACPAADITGENTSCRLLAADTLRKKTASQEKADSLLPVEREAGFDYADLLARIKYPYELKENGVEGKVIVKVLISATGKVEKIVTVESDHEAFTRAVEEAVRETGFTPAVRNRQKVTAWVVVPVKFRLPG